MDEVYDLGRDYTSYVRLNTYHYFWKETLGFLLPSDVSLREPNLKIADIGTGSAKWLLDLAKEANSSAQLDGFDISTAGYPPDEWLPSNVKLHKHNIFDELPEHMHNIYDVVHLRLCVRVIQDTDPHQVLDNCLKLLKPGGLLQWEEFDLESSSVATSKPSVPRKQIEILLDKLKSFASPWVPSLPTIFESRGLTGVSTVRRNEDDSMNRYMMDAELVLADEYAASGFESKGLLEEGAVVRKLARDVYAEVQQGATIKHTFQLVTGRKPTSASVSLDSQKAKPTIVFVPGAFHVDAHFKPMIETLAKASFPAVTADLPTQSQPRTATYKDDVYAVRALLEKLVEEEGKEVILAPHSYGGVPACQTVSGLERSKRQREGKPGGVIQVFFIAALLIEQGRSLVEALDGGTFPDWVTIKDGLPHPGNTKPVFYNDLPPDEAEHWNSLLVPRAATRTRVDVADVCYDLDIDTTVLLCTEDVSLPLNERMALEMKRPRWRIVRMGGGHSPFLGRKEELLQIIQDSLLH